MIAAILVAGALGHCRGVTAANGYPPLEASLVEGTIVPAVLKALADSTLPGGPPRPLLAGMVRHAFHDCAGERLGGTGAGFRRGRSVLEFRAGPGRGGQRAASKGLGGRRDGTTRLPLLRR